VNYTTLGYGREGPLLVAPRLAVLRAKVLIEFAAVHMSLIGTKRT
jgi:hypothetical protein